ncbi:hypothetical protein IC575_024942 [Cucumis melo]
MCSVFFHLCVLCYWLNISGHVFCILAPMCSVLLVQFLRPCYNSVRIVLCLLCILTNFVTIVVFFYNSSILSSLYNCCMSSLYSFVTYYFLQKFVTFFYNSSILLCILLLHIISLYCCHVFIALTFQCCLFHVFLVYGFDFTFAYKIYYNPSILYSYIVHLLSFTKFISLYCYIIHLLSTGLGFCPVLSLLPFCPICCSWLYFGLYILVYLPPSPLNLPHLSPIYYHVSSFDSLHSCPSLYPLCGFNLSFVSPLLLYCYHVSFVSSLWL